MYSFSNHKLTTDQITTQILNEIFINHLGTMWHKHSLTDSYFKYRFKPKKYNNHFLDTFVREKNSPLPNKYHLGSVDNHKSQFFYIMYINSFCFRKMAIVMLQAEVKKIKYKYCRKNNPIYFYLIQKTPERPYITFKIITMFMNSLRAHIIRRSH